MRSLVPTQLTNTELRQNLFRVGLNYRIGGNSVYTPVAAANWAGWYLGGNIGSGTGRDRTTLTGVSPVPEQFNLVSGWRQRRRADRLQLAGIELGLRSRSRHPGVQPA
jgi:hypothetical protein